MTPDEIRAAQVPDAHDRSEPWDYATLADAYDEARAIAADALERVAELEAGLQKAQWALQPFADCVFYDNGDMTVTSSARISSYECLGEAYFAYKVIRALLAKQPEDGRDV